MHSLGKWEEMTMVKWPKVKENMSLTINNPLRNQEKVWKRKGASQQETKLSTIIFFLENLYFVAWKWICFLQHTAENPVLQQTKQRHKFLSMSGLKGFKIKQVTFIVFGIYRGRQDEDFLFSLLCWIFIYLFIFLEHSYVLGQGHSIL